MKGWLGWAGSKERFMLKPNPAVKRTVNGGAALVLCQNLRRRCRPLTSTLGLMVTTVFIVEHLHVLPSGEEDIKRIGVYTSRELATSAVQRLAKQPGFREAAAIIEPETNLCGVEGFYISATVLDLDYWTEGYVTE